MPRYQAEAPIPAAIFDMRQAAQLTQAQAAALVYSSPRSWEDWESGRRPMHAGLWELFVRKVRAR